MFVFIVQGRLLIVSVMVHTSIRTSALGLSLLASNCPTNCSCISATVTCNGTIPDVVPDNTEEVVLVNLDSYLAPRRFCNVTWKNVKNMGILYDYYVTLSDHVFDCLGQIESMEIKGTWVLPTNQTFYGLKKLTELDLSESTNSERTYKMLFSIRSNCGI